MATEWAVGHRVEPAAKQPHPAALHCLPKTRDPDRGVQRRDVIVNKLSRPKAVTACPLYGSDCGRLGH